MNVAHLWLDGNASTVATKKFKINDSLMFKEIKSQSIKISIHQ